MIKEEYRKTVDEQHASEELIQKTLNQMNQVSVCSKESQYIKRNKGNRKIIVYATAFAACVLIATGVLFYTKGNQISFVNVSAPNNVESEFYLSQEDQEPEALMSKLQHRFVAVEVLLPQGILEGKSTSISGYKVFWGYDPESKKYYAVYEVANGWEVLYSTCLEQKEFVKEVREYLAEKIQ